jgi:hypothetical protein
LLHFRGELLQAESVWLPGDGAEKQADEAEILARGE